MESAVNVYSQKFTARCPVDGSIVDYSWTLHTCNTYMAEELRRIADGFAEGLHERIADALHGRFGGQQTLEATHAGDVHIKTLRPEFVHWARPAPASQVEEGSR